MKEFTNKLALHAEWVLCFFLLLGGVLAAAAGIRYILRRRQKKKSVKGRTEWLYTFLSDNPFQTYIFLRGADAFPFFVSENVEQVFGLTKSEMDTDVFALARCMKPEEAHKLERQYRNWNRREPMAAEFSFVNPQNERRGEASLWVQYRKKEDVYVLVLEDISSRKKEEETLRQELAAAKEENEAKTEFLSEMSHEIRTPMNGILGLLELAKMEIADQGTVLAYLEKTQNLSRFLLHLINDVLDLTRIENGKVQLAQEEFDLIDMAHELQSMFAKSIAEKNLHFELHVEGFTARRVVGDAMRLSQVIINFLSNAVKFTETGGSVTLTFRQMERIEERLRLMIRVRDTGKGIEPEFLGHIFRPFEQESSMIARKYGGSGLGMAIADNIVRLMGGQIVIDSEVGKGSDFIVFLSLPVAKEEEKTGENRQQKKAEIRTGTGEELLRYVRGAHVLLAEDNDINARIILAILEKAGAKIDRAVTGRQAVEMFACSEEGEYDVILMDIQMPEMDGWEATRRIRSMEREDAALLPVYALSANSYVEDRRRSLEAGMNGHIAKPIDFEELKQKMGAAIRDRRTAWNAVQKQRKEDRQRNSRSRSMENA